MDIETEFEMEVQVQERLIVMNGTVNHIYDHFG